MKEVPHRAAVIPEGKGSEKNALSFSKEHIPSARFGSYLVPHGHVQLAVLVQEVKPDQEPVIVEVVYWNWHRTQMMMTMPR